MAASLLIFHVAASAQSLLENKKFESETFIKSISHHFKFDNISLSVIDVGDNSLVEAIEKFVKHNRPNLLTMRIHKRNFLKKIFEPSKTKEISYHLSIPLMAVKWKK